MKIPIKGDIVVARFLRRQEGIQHTGDMNVCRWTEGRIFDKREKIGKMFKKRTVTLQIEIEFMFIWETNIILYISVSLTGPKLLDTDLLSPLLKSYIGPSTRVSFGYVKE